MIIPTTSGRLPNEYQEVEYIESWDYQYIDTGVNLKDYDQNLDIELVADIASSKNGCNGLSYHTSGGRYLFSFPEVSGGSIYIQCNAGTWATFTNPYGKTTYKLNSKLGTCSVGNNPSSVTPGSFISAAGDEYKDRGSLYLFASHDWSIDYIADWIDEKLYSLKIKNATTGDLIRDFVPCYRKADGEVGLYDTVGRTFYTDASSDRASFRKGADVVGTVTKWYIDVNGQQKEVRRVTNSNGDVLWNALPSIYQQVEYIESSGTQAINTGVDIWSVCDKFKCEIDMQILDVAQTSYAYQGVGNWGGYYGYYLKIPGSIHSNTLVFSSGQYATSNAEYPNDYQRHLYSFDCVSETLYVDGVFADDFEKENSPDAMGNIFLFCGARRNTIMVGVKERMYSCKFYFDGEIIRDFVPCYRISDSEIGLYDFVTGTFFANAGSGTFTKGNDI